MHHPLAVSLTSVTQEFPKDLKLLEREKNVHECTAPPLILSFWVDFFPGHLPIANIHIML